MKFSLVALVCSVAVSLATGARADEWKMAQAPLMTRWASEVSPQSALPAYPRPTMVRPRWQNLNGLWDYAITPLGDPQPTTFDGQILVPFPVESALSGVMQPLDEVHRLWYRRRFAAPQGAPGNRVLLHFGAVDWESRVWLNGRELGVHQGGYDDFTYDISDVLKPGKGNELVVSVFDPSDSLGQPTGKQFRKPGGIFYSNASGIWQTVWLESVPASSIESLQIMPDVDAARVEVRANGRGTNAKQSLEWTVFDGGKAVGKATSKIGEAAFLKLPQAKLWSPDAPFLYDLKVTLRDGKTVLDSVTSYFGMRKIALGQDAKNRPQIFLNNAPFFPIGVLDHGYWPDGIYTAPTDDALRFDLETTKKLGFNTSRKHSKIEPERWYYWADKLGVLVWQDMPQGYSDNPNDERKADFERELRALIVGRRQHPCLGIWTIFSEGWGQHDTEKLTQLVKESDPTRLVDSASGWIDKGVGDLADLHKYPAPGTPRLETRRAAVLGEFGGLGLRLEGHQWSRDVWGYQGLFSRPDELTRRYATYSRRIHHDLIPNFGLTAAIYRQLTDVEVEATGLLTYDRAVVKPDLATVFNGNRGLLPPVIESAPVPTSKNAPQVWKFTTQTPAANWFAPDFDDSAWKSAPAGFGRDAEGVRTPWETSDLWARRAVILPAKWPAQIAFATQHDDGIEIYINGVLAASTDDWSSDYVEIPINAAGRAALKPGQNVLAAHVKQTGGAQFFDVGIIESGHLPE